MVQAAGETEEWFQIRASEFSVRDLSEVRFVWIVVIGLEVAESWRHRIESVIRNGDGLGVLEFCECLGVESEVDLTVITLRGADVGFVGKRFSREPTDTGVVPAFRNVVTDLQLVFASA